MFPKILRKSFRKSRNFLPFRPGNALQRDALFGLQEFNSFLYVDHPDFSITRDFAENLRILVNTFRSPEALGFAKLARRAERKQIARQAVNKRAAVGLTDGIRRSHTLPLLLAERARSRDLRSVAHSRPQITHVSPPRVQFCFLPLERTPRDPSRELLHRRPSVIAVLDSPSRAGQTTRRNDAKGRIGLFCRKWDGISNFSPRKVVSP